MLTACGGGASSGGDGESADDPVVAEEPARTSESTQATRPTEPPTSPPTAASSSPPPEPNADIALGERLLPPTQQGQATIDINEYINFVVGNLDQMWSSFFQQMGMTEPYLTVVVPGSAQTSTFQTQCGNTVITSTFDNAIYCPLDGDGTSWSYGNVATDQDHGAIVIPADTMVTLWNTGRIADRQSAQPGDLAVAFLVAHEFAHHIVDEYARQYNLAAYLNNQPWLMQPVGKYAELMADCAAGLWIWSAQAQQLLEDGDMQEGLEAARSIGDLTFGGPDPHGTSQERHDATFEGILSGSWDSCVASYWKQDPNTDKNKDGTPDVQQNRAYPYPAGYPIPADYLLR
ncbi:neutral zinc metallopeptidase [Blastococcus sp. SYSU DS0973]